MGSCEDRASTYFDKRGEEFLGWTQNSLDGDTSCAYTSTHKYEVEYSMYSVDVIEDASCVHTRVHKYEVVHSVYSVDVIGDTSCLYTRIHKYEVLYSMYSVDVVPI